MLRLIATALLLLTAATVRADIPGHFQPLVPQPPFSFTQRLFDLTPAFEQARAQNKPVFVYLGASDCPPCVDYTKFLDKQRDALKPAFDAVVLVDLRTWLRGPTVKLALDGKQYTVAEFKAMVGDQNPGFSYPWFWLLAPGGKQLKQLPYGLDAYMTVAGHTRLLAR
jgi:thiol-disulfide isomerase/thioredoxin